MHWKRPANIKLVVHIFVLLVIVLDWSTTLLGLRAYRQQFTNAAIKESDNLARAFSEHALRSTFSVQQTLIWIRDRYEEEGGSGELNRSIHEMRSFQRELINLLMVVDENGQVVASSENIIKIPQITGQPFFNEHREKPIHNLWMGKTINDSILGGWGIPMSMRIDKGDASFGGVVVALVNPYYFRDFYTQVDMGPNGTAVLVSTQGTILAGFSGQNPEPFNLDLSNSQLFTLLKTSPAGHYTSPSVLDGTVRIRSYRRVEPYPLVVVVGFSRDEVLGRFYTLYLVALAFAVVFTLMVLSMAFLFLRMLAQEERVRKEIQRVNTELEQRVEERTLQLSTAIDELEEFSYTVAHDLRAPLRSMNGFSQILMDDYASLLDSTGRSHLERIRGASRKMDEMVDDLLKLAHLSRTEMAVKDVDLAHLVRRTLGDFSSLQPEREVEFICPDRLMVKGDAAMLRIAVYHLVENAWKFTASRTPARIEFNEKLIDGERVFFIRDNGVGFDPAYSDKLFKAFTHVRSIDEQEGRGMGLALVERVVRRHNGRIWAEGNPGVGAVFFFTLGE